jgi:hypothetical protein
MDPIRDLIRPESTASDPDTDPALYNFLLNLSVINNPSIFFMLFCCAGNAQKMENSKMMLERQNKELKAKLEEAENSNRAKAKAAIGMLYYFLGVSCYLFFIFTSM